MIMLTRSPKYVLIDHIFVNSHYEADSILNFETCKHIRRDFSRNKMIILSPRYLPHSYNTQFNTDISLSHVRTNLAVNSVLHN